MHSQPPLPTALLPPDHPERAVLAAEVHARPPQPLQAPSRASYVAVQIDTEARAAELTHIEALCRLAGVPAPPASGTQWSASMGALRFKWERHGEFSSYTVFAAGLGTPPFAQPAAALLPAGWLAGVPGQTVFAAHAELAPAAGLTSGPSDAPTAAQLGAYFDSQVVVGVGIGDGAG